VHVLDIPSGCGDKHGSHPPGILIGFLPEEKEKEKKRENSRKREEYMS